MRNPLPAVRAWGRKAWLATKAFEDALDARSGGQVQGRLEHLERRIAALEHGCPQAALSQPHLTEGRTP